LFLCFLHFFEFGVLGFKRTTGRCFLEQGEHPNHARYLCTQTSPGLRTHQAKCRPKKSWVRRGSTHICRRSPLSVCPGLVWPDRDPAGQRVGTGRRKFGPPRGGRACAVP
jgi:hypothetical protein